MSVPTEIIINQSSENQILAENGFYWREKESLKVLVCKPLEENGFVNAFSTRLGGVSPFPENALSLSGFDDDSAENILENRRRFLDLFAKKFKLTSVWQIHSDLVKTVVSQEDIENTEEKFDALISSLKEVLIGVKTADCVPVLIGDTKTKAFAAIHAGWRGTVESIVIKAIIKMTETYGTDPQDLVCAIGPAATCKSYEIGQDVIENFQKNFPNIDHIFTQNRENHALIDLHLANKEQLLSIGVNAANIYVAPFCTMERTDLFFSYRLERKTGRLMSVIGRD